MAAEESSHFKLRSAAKRVARPAISLLIAIVVGAACLAARRLGWLERLELLAYDQTVRLEARNPAPAAPILIVLIDENDIQAMPQYPLTDGILADLLSTLLDHHPAAIGIDVFRDKTIPAGLGDDGPRRLAAILIKNNNIIWNFKFKGKGSGVGAPGTLQSQLTDPRRRVPLRVGFVDVEADIDGAVRRMILRITTDENRDLLSLDLQLARVYLHLHDGAVIRLGLPNDPLPTIVGKAVLQPLGQNDGPYVDRPVNGIQLWHDFAGPKSFNTIHLRDALKGQFADADVNGAIVLVGVDAESEKDHFATPLNTDPPEAGVSIHARSVDQLIRLARGASPIRFWSKAQESQYTLAWGLAGGLLGWLIRSPRFFVIILALGCGVLALTTYAALHGQLWLPLVPPLICWTASPMFVTSYISHQEKSDRTVLMGLFAKHVSPEVADTIWQRRDEFIRDGLLVPRAQEATVLFTDLRDFTTLSEKLDAAALISLINEYMGRMTRAVTHQRGVVNKYIGDSIMAIFGAPLPSTTPAEIADDAVRAVRCALEMRRELAALNADWKARGLGTVQMRVGVHTGPLVAGSVGGADRLEYTVLGDTVNTASRLESYDKEIMDADIAAGGCRIIIGPRTSQLSDGQFITRPLGEIHLKGRKGCLQVYGVIAPANERNLP